MAWIPCLCKMGNWKSGLWRWLCWWRQRWCHRHCRDRHCRRDRHCCRGWHCRSCRLWSLCTLLQQKGFVKLISKRVCSAKNLLTINIYVITNWPRARHQMLQHPAKEDSKHAAIPRKCHLAVSNRLHITNYIYIIIFRSTCIYVNEILYIVYYACIYGLFVLRQHQHTLGLGLDCLAESTKALIGIVIYTFFLPSGAVAGWSLPIQAQMPSPIQGEDVQAPAWKSPFVSWMKVSIGFMNEHFHLFHAWKPQSVSSVKVSICSIIYYNLMHLCHDLSIHDLMHEVFTQCSRSPSASCPSDSLPCCCVPGISRRPATVSTLWNCAYYI